MILLIFKNLSNNMINKNKQDIIQSSSWNSINQFT